MRSRWVLLILVLCLTWLTPVRSVRAVNITAAHAISEEVVEVGDPVTVTLQVSLDEDIAPHSPNLAVPPGFTASRANTSTMKLQVNRDFRRDYTARWVLVPDEVGTFEIGPPSVQVDSTRVTATGKLTLTVVAKGQGPSKAGPKTPPGFGGMDRFFAPKAPFDLDDPFFEYATPRTTFLTGRDLKLPRALDANAFLYIHADKTEVMVGEQITISYWVYFNVELMGIEDYREPPLASFTREPLAVPAAMQRRAIETSVGGRLYGAKQYGEVAIFPMRAGELTTGKWTAKVEILRAVGAQLLPRESNDVVIHVKEPPATGRPLGYRSGTVGRFKMTAEVDPRETVAGDTTSVSVEVTGVGRLPSELRLPSRLGIEWLKPERKDAVSMVHGNVGGWRKFDYVVRFTEPGEHDLGNVELPYWDPDKGRYEIATAELGRVRVRPSTTPNQPVGPQANDGEADPFEGMGDPRPELRAFAPRADDGLAPATLFTWMLTPPAGVALTSLVTLALRRARRRREEKEESPAILAKRALAEAAAATDAKDQASRVERALHLAVEAKTALKSRGMLASELRTKLSASIGEDLANEVMALFDLCSAVRFEPTADAGDESLTQRAAKTVSVLLSP